MPHRRRSKKGSFGGHFDELVKQFPNENKSRDAEKPPPKSDERSVHDKLFERAWSHERD